MAPSARLEHATYCSASKRSNPLSYEGKQGDILSQLDMTVKCNPLQDVCTGHVQKFGNKSRVEVFARLVLDILNGIFF